MPARISEHRRRYSFARAIRFLRAGTRSTAELRLYLQRQGVPAREIERAVVEGTRRGFLDDAACAKLWATQLGERGLAWALVRSRLAMKGLETRVIEKAVAPLEAEEPDAVRARAVAAARLQRRTAGGALTARRHLMQWLARRGYDAEMIEEAVATSSNCESAADD